MRRSLLAALALLLALPPASAAGAELFFSSPDPVRVAGALVVSGGDASFRLDAPGSTAAYALEIASGRVEVHTYRRAAGTVAGAGAQPPLEEPQTETLALRPGPFVVHGEGMRVVLVGVARGDGALRIEASGALQGLPAWLASPVDDPAGGAQTSQGPERLPIRWRTGDPFFGSIFLGRDLGGFPTAADALNLTGAWSLDAFGGGVARFHDADGAPHEVTLGVQPGGPVAREGPLIAGVETVRMLRLEAVLVRAALPPGATWGASIPDATWEARGEAHWTRATGRAWESGRERAFQDAPVEARGAVAVTPARPGAALAPQPWHGAGDGDAWRVGGQGLAPAPRASLAAPVVGLTGLAALGFLLVELLSFPGRALGAFYTRLARGDVLRHERRQALHALVLARPGLHLRELHRALGGAWGPFTFHLGVLARAGYVRVVRQGRYSAVYPQAAAPATPAVHHPVARRIHETLPPQGDPMRVGELQARLGLPRQLVSYHLRRLEAQGAVLRAPEAGRGAFRRAPAGTPPAAER